MLQTCQLVNFLGGTVVYEGVKTIVLSWTLFSLLLEDRFFYFFSIMKGKSPQQFSRILLILIQTKMIENELEIKRKRGRERRGKEKGLERKGPCIQVCDKCFQRERSREYWWVYNRDLPVTKFTRDTDTEKFTSDSHWLSDALFTACLSLFSTTLVTIYTCISSYLLCLGLWFWLLKHEEGVYKVIVIWVVLWKTQNLKFCLRVG